jgi:hypothetical protein
MKYENGQIPNFVLNKAVNKLNTYGYEVFEMFANEVDMSFCDRNRCIAKCKISYGRSDLREMACPDELKRDRWDYYLKVLKYPTKKAKKLLDLIDKSYGDQFVPDIKSGLAGGMFEGV